MEKIINQLNEFLKWTYMWFGFYDETKKEVVFIDDEWGWEFVCENNKAGLEYMRDKLEEYKERYDD